MAASRGGIRTVIIPHENERDLVEIPKNIKQNLEIKPVRWIDEVLEIALTSMPVPLNEDETAQNEKSGTEKETEEKDHDDRGLRHH